MVCIGDGSVTTLLFVEDIHTLANEEREIEVLVESLDRTCRTCKIVISAKKTKLIKETAQSASR